MRCSVCLLSIEAISPESDDEEDDSRCTRTWIGGF